MYFPEMPVKKTGLPQARAGERRRIAVIAEIARHRRDRETTPLMTVVNTRLAVDRFRIKGIQAQRHSC
jgi:hypothetical protein